MLGLICHNQNIVSIRNITLGPNITNEKKSLRLCKYCAWKARRWKRKNTKGGDWQLLEVPESYAARSKAVVVPL